MYHNSNVAAFHLECKEKKISATNLFSMSAKFNGLNFKLVNQISPFNVELVVDNETYHVKYPDAIIAGIFSLKTRFLWSGSALITCKETNMSISIDFKDQKMFKDVFELNGVLKENDEILGTIQGEWNKEVLYLSDNQETCLCSNADTTNYTKTVDPDSTSITIWQHVISAMKSGDSSRARKLKTEIEVAQRKLEKSRENPFVPKYFAKIGDSWTFRH